MVNWRIFQVFRQLHGLRIYVDLPFGELRPAGTAAQWSGYSRGSTSRKLSNGYNHCKIQCHDSKTHNSWYGKLPYRSRISGSGNFNDVTTFFDSHCLAQQGTNGVDLNAPDSQEVSLQEKPVARFQQKPAFFSPDTPKERINVMLDTSPLSDVVLPPQLTPTSPVNGSRNVAQFFLLDDNKTGVLALGSFEDPDFDLLLDSLLTGLINLKSLGANQLVVDVVCLPPCLWSSNDELRVALVEQRGWFCLCRSCEYSFPTRSLCEVDRNTTVFAPYRVFCWFLQPPSCSQ